MGDLKSLTKSKIICTLGPSSHSIEHIKKLSSLGMDCTRINFSHGTKEYKTELFNNVRQADSKLAILCDIQGPKIRIGQVIEGGVLLHRDEKITITTDECIGDQNRISISYDRLPQEIQEGDLIYINDGIVCLKVDQLINHDIMCHVIAGGHISTRKGVNLPLTDISLKVPTDKDIEDLKLIAELNPEYIAVSFVADENDIIKIRNILTGFGNNQIKLIAKIERPVALQNFEKILDVSDGIMVARGDLGVEISPEEVIPVQKSMIKKCNIVGKPVIVATQMLESMIKASVPTRAEISDVYNAIGDGADAVMLSAETASGEFPGEAVAMMERIIRSSELLIPSRNPDAFDSGDVSTSELIGHLVFSASKELADRNQKGKIICLTRSGYSALMISKYRPNLPIFGITSNLRAKREMRLFWGVEPLLLPEIHEAERTMDRIHIAVKACYENGYVEQDESIIITGSNLFDFTHHTNMISIITVNDVLNSDIS